MRPEIIDATADELESMRRAAAMSAATKPAIHSTEFWGKTVVQLVMLAKVLFRLDIEVSDEMALTIVAGAEALHQLVRGIIKATAARSAGRPN